MTREVRLYKSDLFELALTPAAASLRPYVHDYTAWRDRSTRSVSRRHVPSGDIPMIFNFAARVRERTDGHSEWTE